MKRISQDPTRKLVVIDPKRTESAAMADIHLQVRPGTDAFLLAAIL
jgi:anaerobic selenocysteine-containing dehydrogenase